MDKAKVFWSGRSQAVRLPKKYRFDSEEVSIRRRGNEVVLSAKAVPEADQWAAWVERMPGQLDDDFVGALEEDVLMPPDDAVPFK